MAWLYIAAILSIIGFPGIPSMPKRLPTDRSDDMWKAYVGSMAFYGSVGVLIDRGHQARTPLYRAPAGVSLTGRVSW